MSFLDLQNLPLKDKLQKEDNECSLEFLVYSEKKLSELRTTYDIVLYQTAQGWNAVIDLTETGDLQNALNLTEFSKTKDLKSIDDYLSISMNVHNDGNVLEIVGMCCKY